MNKDVEKKRNNTMKELFKGYSQYSNKEYLEIWEHAIIVVDANILLNFYRLSNETRTEIYEILKSLKKRLWIPYQVAYEYFKNKEKVIVDANNDFDKLLADSTNCFSTIIKKVNEKSSKRLKCKDELLKELTKSEEKIKQIITENQNSSKEKASEENVEKLIFELFNDSVGIQISGEEYEEIKNEGIKRFKEQIPPGYKDASKEENGDYYIFYSMMNYAKENKKHIIFVTDDVKEDWFTKRFGEIKSGDYRILNEFYEKTGQLLLIYTSDGFINSYQKNVKNSRTIDSNVIDELVANRSANYEQEYFISHNNYIKKINHMIKRLEDYENYPMSITLRTINILQDLLMDVNIFDENVDIMIKFLRATIRRRKTEDVKVVLEDLKQYICTKPRFNKLEKEKRINDIEILGCEDVNDFKLESDSIYGNISKLISKLEKITDEELKKNMMEKIMLILEKVKNNKYLRKNEIIKLNYEIEKISIEIDELLNESVL